VTKYFGYVTQTMGRTVEVDADSLGEAIEKIYDQGDFNVNISNNFEEDGEIELYDVYDEGGKTVEGWKDFA
jgi:hypothetical protein